MRTSFFKALIALAFAAGSTLASASTFSNIDVQQGQAMARQGAVLIDVREPHEYAAGHAPGSMLVSLGQLMSRINEIRGFENKPVVLICRSGNRSAQAAELLARQGFKSVHNVQGGMIAWEKAGLPVAR